MHEFRADLHIHSRFSRATSPRLTFGLLNAWAKIKGIDVLGTGDFTHPAWRNEMYNQLVFDEEAGLYRMKDAAPSSLAVSEITLADEAEQKNPFFLIQGEISSIYKRNGQVRKVHNLVFMPDLASADAFCKRLESIGNLVSDGRPILGLDSRDLLEIVLETHEKAFLIPAHIWTPWFSVFGSKSGFNDINDCFGDLTDHIFALETGLSSDPAMNRLWSALDRFRLVSNSDAHSGENLGREVNLFEGNISYNGIFTALKQPDHSPHTRFKGTLEFFPEEGKYHDDGHRKCHIHFTPEETRAHQGICPVCGHPLTVGVLYRVMELADRKEPEFNDGTHFTTVVPLPEVLGEILGVGSKTRKVTDMYTKVLANFGSELHVLQTVPENDLAKYFPPLGEAIARMRRGEVFVTSGYDGEYGVVRMFTEQERHDIIQGAKISSSRGKKSKIQGLSLLGEGALPVKKNLRQTRKKMIKNQEIAPNNASASSNIEKKLVEQEQGKDNEKTPTPPHLVAQTALNEEQEIAALAGPAPILVIAGPGSGKTRTLIARITNLIEDGINPKRILAVTFTRKAATEMDQRLTEELPGTLLPRTDTLHALALDVWLKTNADVPVLLSEESAQRVFIDTNLDKDPQLLKDGWNIVNLARERMSPLSEPFASMAQNYAAHKSAWNLVDYTDLLEFWIERTASGLDKSLWDHVLVDEIQDLSTLQLTLIRSILPAGGEGFFGIGDPDQSIYGFRGADAQCLEYFKAIWPGLEIITLKQNYRSCAEILQAAVSVLNKHATCKSLNATRKEKGYIHLFHAPSADSEGRWIADRVRALLGSTSHTMLDIATPLEMPLPHRGYAPGDIGIFVRTHALGHSIRKFLARIGIPVSEPKTDAFWEDPRIALILRSIGRLYGIAIASPDTKDTIPDCPDTVIAKGPLGIAAYLSTVPPFEEHFWQSRAYRNFIKAYDMNKGWSGLLSWINLQNEHELIKRKSQKVQILSIHAAKGLEFPIVFLPCMEDGLLPFAGPGMLTGRLHKSDATDLEEERRLLYVGLTRAKDALFISCADKRTLFGHEMRLKPSRFLQAIPKELTTASTIVVKNLLSEEQLNLL